MLPLQVIDTLAQQAGAGGVHEGTLLLVFGDHGQTLNGDHGGGTAEELDTALLAVNMAAAHAALAERSPGVAAAQSAQVCAADRDHCGGSEGSQLEGDRGNVSPPVTEAGKVNAVNKAALNRKDSAARAISSIAQLDFAASLSALMGLPIPFESIGAHCLRCVSGQR